MLDLIIVISYFAIIFLAALSGRTGKDVSAETYFLSGRNLRWPSIALSTIATNIQGYQFLGMMGSAYLYGLAQASLEINAIQGILIAAFFFVPLYLKHRVVTITQFIEMKLGKTVARTYSLANLALFSTITLGAALFWGAYAAEIVFFDYLAFLHESKMMRIAIMVLVLGLFSAIYTYLGGLSAVVKTDIIQFIILLVGGIIITVVTLNEAGGFGELYRRVPEKMHLHLPADHPVLPWIHIFGLFLLNINYWCANQTVIQRSLAARSLSEAQTGLMVGGVLKYAMAVVIVVPGVALASILLDSTPLSDPDQVFPYLVNQYLPIGIKGLVLCALFASLMSTVDSTFNSIATLWSVDIFKGWIKPTSTDREMVSQGKKAILITFISGTLMGLILLYLKFENPEAAFTHQLNSLRYYINCGIVVLILTALLFTFPNKRWTLVSFFLTVPLHLIILQLNPDINYFTRAFFVITIGFGVSAIAARPLKINDWTSFRSMINESSKRTRTQGIALLLSLILVHVLLH